MKSKYKLYLLFILIVGVICDKDYSVLQHQKSRFKQNNQFLEQSLREKPAAQTKRIEKENLKISRVYHDVNKGEFQQFTSLKADQGNENDYEFFDKIGEGAFSEVFTGKRKSDEQPVVLKKMKAYKNKALNREISVLQSLQNSSKYIVNMIDVVRDIKNNTAVLVYSYIESLSFAKMAADMNLYDIKFYLFQLLSAVDESHSRGIMHRDIKLTNIIINEQERRLVLIDWGLGEYYHAEKNYSTRVGTRNYKAPELLLGNQFYDYAVDMWSTGCIVGHLIFRRHPMFKGKDNDQVLQKISTFLGTEDLYAYINKYGLVMTKEIKDSIKPQTKKDWQQFITEENAELVTGEGLDLVSKLLVYDHRVRLTAKESMAHAFFDAVRQQF